MLKLGLELQSVFMAHACSLPSSGSEMWRVRRGKAEVLGGSSRAGQGGKGSEEGRKSSLSSEKTSGIPVPTVPAPVAQSVPGPASGGGGEGELNIM